MRFIKFTLLFCLLLSARFSFAQDSTEHFGCHFTKNKLSRVPLSKEEKIKARAGFERSDTIDIIDYATHLDVSNYSGKKISGNCVVTFSPKMDDIDYINLDLEGLTVDSVLQNGQIVTFDYSSPLLTVYLDKAYQKGENTSVDVYYRGTPITSPSGFGGMYFENNVVYNLGIGLTDQPHNYGRAWFPCFDNFVERSTYLYDIISRPNTRAYCVGTFISNDTLPDNKVRTVYKMSQQIPTYLSAIASGPFVTYDTTFQGDYSVHPIQLVVQQSELAGSKLAFQQLGKAVDILEKWYGEYAWERVGYVLTSRGAMEHPTNIAYPSSSATAFNDANNRLLAHELCHHWWGDLTTLKTAQDMWIKEGNAEYGAHLFVEYTKGKSEFVKVVRDNNSRILRSAHIDDDEYLPLSPMPDNITYGTTTYYKGAAMLHNLRGYLGDSLFSKGQKAVLTEFSYANLEASSYRDFLSQATGVDLTHFFDDWIFNTGWSDFDLVQWNATQITGGYKVHLKIQQKLYHSQHLHTQVPVYVTVFDKNFNPTTQKVYATGEYSEMDITVPFEPGNIIINAYQELNLGEILEWGQISPTQTVSTSKTRMVLTYNNVKDTSVVAYCYHLTAPDPMKDLSKGLQLSTKQYWTLSGNMEPGMRISCSMQLDRSNEFDNELLQVTADSLIFLYRKDDQSDWAPYPNAKLQYTNPKTGFLILRCDSLIAGQYCFAIGIWTVGTDNPAGKNLALDVYPNPARDMIHVIMPDISNFFGNARIDIMDATGKTVLNKTVRYQQGNREDINTNSLPAGTYIVVLSDQKGIIHSRKKIIIDHSN